MKHRNIASYALIGSLAFAPLSGLTGCSKLPGGAKEQGADAHRPCSQGAPAYPSHPHLVISAARGPDARLNPR